MRLHIDGAVNQYYVQTLCMIYFPGSKFSNEEEPSPDVPELWLTVRKTDEHVDVHAKLCYRGKEAEADSHYEYNDTYTNDRTDKIAVGDAVTNVGAAVVGYRSAWGMLTGVRPSKVATEMLRSGMSKTRVKKELNKQYFVIPKKAALATDVAVNEAKLIDTPDPRDCSIYISIPFCPTRCAYCSFVSYTSKRLLSLIPEYLTRLVQDLEGILRVVNQYGLRVRTIYIGGGTPTILTAEQLRFLLEQIHAGIDVSKVEEFTLEAGRPDTIDAEKLRIAREFGVTRMSVNPQILSDEVLQGIGRSHTTDEFFRAYEIARKSGIPVINTDMIAGLPGDRFSIFSNSFDRIMELRPENVTIHTFCVKRSAELRQLGSDIYSIRGGDTGKCVDYSQIKCTREGYIPYYMYRQKNTVGNYENVGFSLPGKEGLYNIYMMEEVHSILAAGAGAVTKLVEVTPTLDNHAPIERMFNPKYPYEYLDEAGLTSIDAKLSRMEDYYRERL